MTLKRDELLSLYHTMRTARELDSLERRLAQQAEVFFYVPSAGHESMAAIARHLIEADWLNAHYRDRALLLARGIRPVDFLHGLYGNEQSNSGGRRMPGFISDPSLHILSCPTLVGNNALHAVGIAAAVREHPDRPIVLCNGGDGTTQEGEFMEAVAEAVRSRLPVLFLVEDNRYALSTPTAGKTLYSLPDGLPESYYGLALHRVDGGDAEAVDQHIGSLIGGMRADRAPRLAVLHMERLASHTNADDETLYRSEAELQTARETMDPVERLRRSLLDDGMGEDALAALEEEIRTDLTARLEEARSAAAPPLDQPVKLPLPASLLNGSREYRGTADDRSLTMLEAMRETLRRRLAADERVVMLGEDIADPKGDVFGLTRGLSTEFPDRVRNSALSEATIVGEAIGRAAAGQFPVACLQFADFLPPAFNQIFSELGMMHWRSNGRWNLPVIILAICGAYRPGLGPYHAQTPDGLLAHIPGIDVFEPSNAADAAGLLNAAFESGRPTVLLYPKSLINERGAATSADIEKQLVPPGRARVARAGRDLTVVSWGSTLPLCERVCEALEEGNASAELIDLRSLSPWDAEAVEASARKTGRLLVVHEDTRTGGFGAEVAAEMAERMPGLRVAREARQDTHIPYHFDAQQRVLPSLRSILEAAAELLDLDVEWRPKASEREGIVTVHAIGSSPSDETVRIVELHAKPGDRLEEGQIIASVEADKASMELSAPVAGEMEELYAAEGDSLSVGTPLCTLRSDRRASARSTSIDDPGLPVLTKKAMPRSAVCSAAPARRSGGRVILNSIYSAVGSRRMSNEAFLKDFPQWSSEDVKRRTGIEERYWIDPEKEDVLSLAVDASSHLLEAEGLQVTDLDMILCSTGTPLGATTPSLACRILKALSPEKGEVLVQAHDINAACTGWLYALQAAYDTLSYDADRTILVVTAETLSPMIDRTDPDTAFIFGDAATASLLTGKPRSGRMQAAIRRPVLSAMGVDEHILRVPFPGSGEFVEMQGGQVFRVAVRKMVDMLARACEAEGVTVDELDMIVTHQANERIIEAARKMIRFPKERVFNQMRLYGNTSSNTIPLALQTVLPNRGPGDKVGLTAFGGGYTFGAAIIEVL
jgi:2-oxoisovalerate dehydrogenase E1 component